MAKGAKQVSMEMGAKVGSERSRLRPQCSPGCIRPNFSVLLPQLSPSTIHAPSSCHSNPHLGNPMDHGKAQPPQPEAIMPASGGSTVQPGGRVPLTVFLLRPCLRWTLLTVQLLLRFLQDKEKGQCPGTRFTLRYCPLG